MDMKYENEIRRIRELAGKYAPEQLALLQEFASFDSETHDLEGNRRAVDLARKHLEPLGGSFEEVTYEGVGTHLIARLVPENPKGRILVNSHLDTVFPIGFAAQNPPRVEGDYLYGLGVLQWRLCGQLLCAADHAGAGPSARCGDRHDLCLR